jgi:multiple sugar transport system ATP-binding protein
MVAGLESISAGELAIDGRRVNEVPAKDRDIAMVFQSYALYPHMNVFDNLAFGLRRRRRTGRVLRVQQRVRPASGGVGCL